MNENQPEIDIFLDALLAEKGLGMAPDSVKQQLKEDLLPRLEKWLVADIFQHLSEQQAQEFDEFLNSAPSQDQIAEKFKKFIPNYEEVYRDSMLSFKQTYLS